MATEAVVLGCGSVDFGLFLWTMVKSWREDLIVGIETEIPRESQPDKAPNQAFNQR
jgi:hypothetical protein